MSEYYPLNYSIVANIATWISHLILAFLFLSYGFYLCAMKNWNELVTVLTGP